LPRWPLSRLRPVSPFLNAAQLDTKIAKMIKAFGAPIDPADAKTIGDYLKQNYGE
jgi:hypothetical protein